MEELINNLLECKKPEQFADWLWDSLNDLYLGTDNVHKVNRDSKLWQFIIRKGSESPVCALRNLYSNIPESNQESFRQSIGIAFSKCTEVKDKKVYEIIEDLTYLMGATDAIEALDGLLEVATNENFSEKRNNIINTTLACVLPLPPDDRVYDFTHSLVNSPSFKDGYIFTAIKSMVRCKPDDSLKIVDELGDRIQKLYSKVYGDKEEEQTYWEAVSLTFGKRDLPKVIERIHHYSKIKN